MNTFILTTDANDARRGAEFVVGMRHVQRGQQFAKRQIASAAKNNDVLHIAHLNSILFQ